jgi:hypothetical protein
MDGISVDEEEDNVAKSWSSYRAKREMNGSLVNRSSFQKNNDNQVHLPVHSLFLIA